MFPRRVVEVVVEVVLVEEDLKEQKMTLLVTQNFFRLAEGGDS